MRYNATQRLRNVNSAVLVTPPALPLAPSVKICCPSHLAAHEHRPSSTVSDVCIGPFLDCGEGRFGPLTLAVSGIHLCRQTREHMGGTVIVSWHKGVENPSERIVAEKRKERKGKIDWNDRRSSKVEKAVAIGKKKPESRGFGHEGETNLFSFPRRRSIAHKFNSRRYVPRGRLPRRDTAERTPSRSEEHDLLHRSSTIRHPGGARRAYFKGLFGLPKFRRPLSAKRLRRPVPICDNDSSRSAGADGVIPGQNAAEV
jgi:hypothetical protein